MLNAKLLPSRIARIALILAAGGASAQAPPPSEMPVPPAALSSHPGVPTGGGKLSGIWWITDYAPQLVPQGGGTPPFTPAGRARYEQNVVQLKSGDLADPGMSLCLPEGLPRAMFAAYPMQIVEHGNVVTFIHEINHTFWSAAIGGKHAPADDVDPAFMGETIGHWEKDTLVVDTIGFKARSFLDDTGLPHSAQLHVTLRLRPVSHDKLEVVATIDDPEVFTTTWSARRVFERRSDVVLMEYVCGEEHRALTGQRSSGVQLRWSKQ